MYKNANLIGLTVDMVFQHIHAEVLPQTFCIWLTEAHDNGNNNNHNKTNDSYSDFIKAFRLSKLTPQTALNWMKRIGMKYDINKTSFFVDGHKRKDV